MATFAVDTGQVGAAGKDVRATGAQVLGAVGVLVSLVSDIGDASGAAPVAAAAGACAGRLRALVLPTARAGVLLGEGLHRAAAQYAAHERGNTTLLTGEVAL